MFGFSFYRAMGVSLRAWIARRRRELRNRRVNRVRAARLARRLFNPDQWAYLEHLEPRMLLSGSIQGTLFNDFDGDGAKDTGEDGLADWTVFVDQNANSELDTGEASDMTGADGTYTLSGLSSGAQSVVILTPSGWSGTTPAIGAQSITLDTDEDRTDVDFGVSFVSVVDNSDESFVATHAEGESAPEWQNESSGLGDDAVSIATGDGSATAVWTFENLTPGMYRVSVTWPTLTGLSSDARFVVADPDREVELRAIRVDQSESPGSSPASFHDAETDADWQNLGDAVMVGGTSLTVTLDNSTLGDGGIVAADAVRIERVGALDEAPILRLTDGDSDVAPEAACNFGDTVMGAPLAKTFTITNTGLDDLVFDDIPTLPEGFSLAWNLDGDTPGGTLAPGNSATFVIYLDGGYTGTPGSFSGDFSLASNASEEPFTLALSGSVSAIRSADDSDDTFTATDAEGESAPAWQDETTGYGNSSKSIEVGDGSATAVWTFEGLTPGLYRVSVTWPSGSGLATDVTYTIEDVDLDVTLVTTEIDQTSAPDDLSESGTDWEALAASVELCGYTLRVTLTNEAPDSEGATIIADAVRIERVGDLDTTLYLLDVPEESTEGDPITPYAVITGSAGQWLDPALYTFDWTVTKDEVEFATSTDPDFSFTPDDEGTYVISLIVTLDEENGPTYTSSATIEVANAEPTLTLYADSGGDPIEGTEFTLNLSSYDPGDDTITGWTIDWGDGGTPEVVTGNPDTITHTYAEGPLEVTITATATDEDGTFDAESLTVTVANAAPTASFDLTDTVSEGEEATFAFTDADDLSIGDATAGYTYSYDFDGDGEFDVEDSPYSTATHTFDDSGTYFVIGRITDRDGDSSFYVAEIEVGNIGPTLTVTGDAEVTQGDTYSLTLAADDDGVDTIGRWVIDWGDGFIQAVAGTPEDPITHVYRNSGDVTIHVTAKDEDGSYEADPLDITVDNVAPTIDVTPVASDLENVHLGSPLNLLLEHEDPGYDPVDWTIDWGDGHVSRSSGEDATPDDFGIGLAHHAYSQPGDYTITVTANDGTGDSESQQIELTVVTLLAPAPYALDATWQTDNTVDLEWHQSVDGPYNSYFDVEWRRSDESWAGHTATFAATQDSNDPTLWSCNSSSFPLGLPLLPDGVDYEFRVRAHDTALGGGTWSVPASMSTPEAPTLDAPENFEMVQLQMQMLPTYFQWDDVDDESGYAVEIHSDDAPGDGWVTISGVYADSTSSDTFAWTVAPIWAAWPSLDIRVRAFVCDNGFYYYSDSSNVITYSHPGDDVDMPELTIAAVGSDFVTLDYDISQGDYYVVRAIDNVLAGPEAYDQYWSGFGSDYNWTQLVYGQTEVTLYRPNRWADTFYAVGSYNGDGYPRFAGYITVPADATPAPENLAASFDEDGRLTMTWDQPEGTDGYLTEFEIAANDNTFVYFTQFGPAGEGANTYVLTPSWITGEPDTYPLPYDLPAGLTYAFRARTTLNTIAYSPYSSVTTAAAQQPPQAPTALTARVVAFNSIQLLWQDNAHNETGFVVEYSTDATFETGVEAIDDLGPNITNCLVTDLTAGETYYFCVKAINNTGDSDDSNSTSATISLPNLTIDSNNDGQINEDDDVIEDDANAPGKWLVVSDPWRGFDFDNSEAFDLDDAAPGQYLVPLVVKLPDWMNISVSEIAFVYDGTDLTTLSSTGSLFGIALWTTNSAARTLADWISPGNFHSLNGFLYTGSNQFTVYVQGLRGSSQLGDVRIAIDVKSNLNDTGTSIDSVGLTSASTQVMAYRTGNHFGTLVSEFDRQSGDPSKFMALVNDDFDEPTSLNPQVLADFSNRFAAVPGSPGGDAIDDDLVRLSIRQIPDFMTSGQFAITLSHPGAVRLFKADGSLFYEYAPTSSGSLTVNFSNPTGYLSALVQNDVDIWVEALAPVSDFVMSFSYSSDSIPLAISDSIHMRLVGLSPYSSSNLLRGSAESEQVIDSDGVPYSAKFQFTLDGITPDEGVSVSVQSSLTNATGQAVKLFRIAGQQVKSHFDVYYSLDDTPPSSSSQPIDAAKLDALGFDPSTQYGNDEIVTAHLSSEYDSISRSVEGATRSFYFHAFVYKALEYRSHSSNSLNEGSFGGSFSYGESNPSTTANSGGENPGANEGPPPDKLEFFFDFERIDQSKLTELKDDKNTELRIAMLDNFRAIYGGAGTLLLWSFLNARKINNGDLGALLTNNISVERIGFLTRPLDNSLTREHVDAQSGRTTGYEIVIHNGLSPINAAKELYERLLTSMGDPSVYSVMYNEVLAQVFEDKNASQAQTAFRGFLTAYVTEVARHTEWLASAYYEGAAGLLGNGANLVLAVHHFTTGHTVVGLIEAFPLIARGFSLSAKAAKALQIRFMGENVAELTAEACRFYGKGGCFAAGTPVHTEFGLRPIESILAGDRVWAYDNQLRRWVLRTVIAPVSFEQDGVAVTIQTGADAISTTANHPFWVVRGNLLALRPPCEDVPEPERGLTQTGRWVAATDIQIGDVLLSSAGAFIEVTDRSIEYAHRRVYNLVVDGSHTFAVGFSGILVHNTNQVCTEAEFQFIKQNWHKWFKVSELADDHGVYFRINGRRLQSATKAFENGGFVKFVTESGQTKIVKFVNNGFPDFSPFLFKNLEPGQKAVVPLKKLSGSYAIDEALANAAAHFSKTPEGYTWHHSEDLGVMQLVESEVHEFVRHTGGVAIFKAGMAKLYTAAGKAVPQMYL